MSAFIWLAMFDLVLKWLEGGRGTNPSHPLQISFFLQPPAAVKMKDGIDNQVITRKHWAITRKDYLETSRFGHKN